MTHRDITIVFADLRQLLADAESSLIGTQANDVTEGRLTFKRTGKSFGKNHPDLSVTLEVQWPWSGWSSVTRADALYPFRLILEARLEDQQHLQPPAPEPGLEEPEDARDAGAVDQGV